MAAQKSLVWSSGGVDLAGSEGTSSFEDYEHNVDNFALDVVGKKWSVEVVSLPPARTGGIKLPHGNGSFMPRNEECVLGELKVAKLASFTVFTMPEQLSCGIVPAKKPFCQHGRAVTF